MYGEDAQLGHLPGGVFRRRSPSHAACFPPLKNEPPSLFSFKTQWRTTSPLLLLLGWSLGRLSSPAVRPSSPPRPRPPPLRRLPCFRGDLGSPPRPIGRSRHAPSVAWRPKMPRPGVAHPSRPGVVLFRPNPASPFGPRRRASPSACISSAAPRHPRRRPACQPPPARWRALPSPRFPRAFLSSPRLPSASRVVVPPLLACRRRTSPPRHHSGKVSLGLASSPEMPGGKSVSFAPPGSSSVRLVVGCVERSRRPSRAASLITSQNLKYKIDV